MRFPTQLRSLVLSSGVLGASNIGDVALESFEARHLWDIPLARRVLEALPKTLRRIKWPLDPPFGAASRRHSRCLWSIQTDSGQRYVLSVVVVVRRGWGGAICRERQRPH